MEFSRIPQFPNTSTDFAEIWQEDASEEGANLSFHVKLLAGGRFRQDMKKCDILRTSSGRRENAFCPDRPVNMLQSVPSATHLDVHRSIPDLSTLERDVFGCSEKMTISSLRTIRTAVFASSPLRVMFVQPSRHRWQGVLKFSARSAISLPIGSDGRLNF